MTFDLTGKLLISTPAMGDRRFSHSILYVGAHSEEGAFALVLNRPITRLVLGDVLEQVGIAPGPDCPVGHAVLSGGPVETQRGFVLHSGEVEDPDGQPLGESGLILSASTEILRAIAAGQGPRDWLLALGYAGWGPGQLEDEIGQNAWLTCTATRALIFDAAPGEHQWQAALESMGVNPLSLSAVAGRA